LERLLIALESQQVSLPNPRRLLVWLAAHGPAAREASWRLLSDLRQAGIAADMDLSDRSLKAQFKIADREAANFCIVTGDNELAAAQVMLKDLSTGQQSSVPRAQIIAHLVKMMP
jgi:histidyl-tRNA synthetase